jgi:hypothetical protein
LHEPVWSYIILNFREHDVVVACVDRALVIRKREGGDLLVTC